MSHQYRLIHPVKHFRDYLNEQLRPDGREFNKLRPIGITYGTISSSNGSAAVKIGNTCVMCGIRAELAKPTAENPLNGYIVLNVEFLPISSSKYHRNHALCDDSDLFNYAILDVMNKSCCINLKDLCIFREELVWALYLDVVVFEHDGCVFDASLIACLSALKDLKTPTVKYDPDIKKIEVDNSQQKKCIKVQSIPVSTTLLLFGEYIITDPTAEEENLSNSFINVAVSSGRACFVLKLIGSSLNQELAHMCVDRALEKETLILDLINKLNIC